MMTKINYLLSGVLSVVIGLTLAQSAGAAWWNRDSRDTGSDSPVVQAQAESEAARFNRVEAQMRGLTGQVEELTFQLRQLQDQLKRMQEDNDFRFRELEGGAVSNRSERPVEPSQSTERADAAAPAPPTLPSSNAADDRPDAIGTLAGRGEVDMSGPGEPPQPLGTLRLPSSELGDQPIDLTAPPPTGSGDPQVAAIDPTGDPGTDYERAYANVLSGDYDAAEQGFRQFITAYPDDERAPDAQYWLGESLFARAQYREAADAFLTGYKAYPKSGKAPDTLLKLGLSLAGLGEREAACSTFAAVLKQYPDASNALRQRIKVEQSSASC